MHHWEQAISMGQIKLYLFGNFAATIINDGQGLAADEKRLTGFRSDKTRALLAYLALSRGRVLRRKQLMDLLWPDFEEESARLSLRLALHNLNQITKPNKLFHTTYQTVQMVHNDTLLWCDALHLETLLQQQQSLLQGNDWVFLRSTLQQQFLEGMAEIPSLPFQQWLLSQREHYEQICHSLFMESVAMLPPPHAAPPHVSHNLPRGLTPLYGREDDLKVLVRHLVDPDQRLIVVVGEGGMGKTRLALAAAQTIADRTTDQSPSTRSGGADQPSYPDGLWFVPLGDLQPTDNIIDQIVAAIGRVLGLAFIQGVSLLQQLVNRLRAQKLLLILDSFEHFSEAAATLSALLQAAPGVTLLVTSRRRLNLQAATIVPVSELDTPTPQAAARNDCTELLTYPAIQLFVERARRLLPGFQLQQSNSAAIVQICRTMAGLPLGIELAVTLVELYSCAEVAAQLADDPIKLQVEWSDLPYRHRSLERVLAASWQLLTADEARILAQCAVVRGTFSACTIRILTGAKPEQLQRLVQKSLLRPIAEPAGHFLLHDLVRAFARTRLHEQPEVESYTLAQHAGYYMNVVQQQTATLPNAVTAQQILLADLENIRAAWLWSVENGELALLETGLAGLIWFYRLVAFNQEAFTAFQQAAGRLLQLSPQLATDPLQCQRLRAHLLVGATEFARHLGRYQEAEVLAQEAICLSNEVQDAGLLALAYIEQARLAQVQTDFGAMLRWAEQGQLWAYQCDQPIIKLFCLHGWGAACFYNGNLTVIDEVRWEIDQLLAHYPNCYLQAVVTNGLGFIYYWQQDYLTALHYLQQGVKSAATLRQHLALNYGRQMLGDVWLELGAFEQARQMYTEALAFFQLDHNVYWMAIIYHGLGSVARMTGNLEAAYTLLQEALQLTKEQSMPVIEGYVHIELGHTLAAIGSATAALASYQQALDSTAQLNTPQQHLFPTSEAYAGQAELWLAQQQFPAAQSALEMALRQLMQRVPTVRSSFSAYWRCYRVLTALNDPRAATLLQIAQHELQQIARRIHDPILKQSFLTNVPVNRAIITTGQPLFPTG